MASNFIRDNIRGLGLNGVSWGNRSKVSSYDLNLLSLASLERSRESNLPWAPYGWSRVGSIVEMTPTQTVAQAASKLFPGDLLVVGENTVSSGLAKLFTGPSGLTVFVDGNPIRLQGKSTDSYLMDLTSNFSFPVLPATFVGNLICVLEVWESRSKTGVYPKGNTSTAMVTDSSVSGALSATKVQTVYKVAAYPVNSITGTVVNFSIDGIAVYPVPDLNGAAYKYVKPNPENPVESIEVTVLPISVLSFTNNNLKPESSPAVFTDFSQGFRNKLYANMVIDYRSSVTADIAESARNTVNTLVSGTYRESFPYIQNNLGQFSVLAPFTDSVAHVEPWGNDVSSKFRLSSYLGYSEIGPVLLGTTLTESSIPEWASMDSWSDSLSVVDSKAKFVGLNGSTVELTNSPTANTVMAFSSVEVKNNTIDNRVSTPVSSVEFLEVVTGPGTSYRVPVAGQSFPLEKMKTFGVWSSPIQNGTVVWQDSLVKSYWPSSKGDRSAGVVASIKVNISTPTSTILFSSDEIAGAKILHVDKVYTSSSVSVVSAGIETISSVSRFKVTTASAVSGVVTVDVLLKSPVGKADTNGVIEMLYPTEIPYSVESSGDFTHARSNTWEFENRNTFCPIKSFAFDQSGRGLGISIVSGERESVFIEGAEPIAVLSAFPLSIEALEYAKLADNALTLNNLRAPTRIKSSINNNLSVLAFINVFPKDSGSVIPEIKVGYFTPGYRASRYNPSGEFLIENHVSTIITNEGRGSWVDGSFKSFGGIVLTESGNKILLTYGNDYVPGIALGVFKSVSGNSVVIEISGKNHTLRPLDKIFYLQGTQKVFTFGKDHKDALTIPTNHPVVFVSGYQTEGSQTSISTGDTLEMVLDQSGNGQVELEVSVEAVNEGALPSSLTIAGIIVTALPFGTSKYRVSTTSVIPELSPLVVQKREKVNGCYLAESLPSAFDSIMFGPGPTTEEAYGILPKAPVGSILASGLSGPSVRGKGVVGVKANGFSSIIEGVQEVGFDGPCKVAHFMVVRPYNSRPLLGVLVVDTIAESGVVKVGAANMATAAFDVFEISKKPL